MKPVEGTILTVSRGAASAAIKKAESTNDAVEVMRAALDGAKAALAKTPEMLPVLKEVGVVDSGGQGLVSFMKVSCQPSQVSISLQRTSKRHQLR